MRIKYLALLLLLVPIQSLGQSTNSPQFKSEEDLLSALLAIRTQDQATAAGLLRDHRSLVTARLGNSLLRAATTSAALGDPARPLFICGIAKEAALLLDDKQLLGFVFYKTGRFQFEHDNIKAAMEEYLFSKNSFEQANSVRDLIYVLAELGTLHIYEADYKKAEDYSRQSLSLAGSFKDSGAVPGAMPDEYGTAFAWSNLGNIAKWKGDYDAALDGFLKSLNLWRELTRRGYWSAGNVVDALIDISHVYQALGNHRQVLNYLSQAMGIAKTLLDRGRLAAVFNDLGVLYIEQGDYVKASEFIDQSLKIFTQKGNRREVARNKLNLGVIDYRQKRYEVALEEFRDSLKKAEEVEAAEIAIAAQEGLGSVYQAERNYAQASEWFETAWTQAQRIGDKMRMVELLWRKGQVFYSEGDYARSSVAAENASDLATRLQSPLMTYLALTLKGESFGAQKADDLASQSFIQAIEAVEHLRDEVAGAEKELELFFENKVSPYHEMVAMLVERNKGAEALKYAERAKGRVLLDVLRNGRISITKSLTQAEQGDEHRLYTETVSLNTQVRAEKMRQEPDEAKLSDLQTRLQKARSAYEVFQAALYAAHPELKVKRGVFSEFTLEDAGAAIPDSGTAVLEYVVTGEQAFLFVLTKGSASQAEVRLDVRSINIKKSDLSDLVEKYRSLLSTNHPGFRQSGRELYDLLVKPAESYLMGKTTVCIVPDGPLWNLPFQALQSGRDRYMLESYAIYYAPSLQVLLEMRQKSNGLQSPPAGNDAHKPQSLSSRAWAGQLYAVGNPALGGEAVGRAQALRNAPFVPLPETEQEVHALAEEVYGPEASIIRVGTAAREDTVKAEIGKYRVVHLASHGVVDDRNPLYSYIVLAPSSDLREDGLLEAWELMEMELKAELVVLSACDLARGRVGDGEGMIGMTWALFVAGVPTTVASQWQVPSQSTTKLMVAFHKKIQAQGSAKKMSKAEAWRQAALGMMVDPRYRMKPYYWAGFVVVGDGCR